MPKLLIIDDEPNVCYSLEKVLQSSRLQVVSADTARKGIEAVRAAVPDAVILDVRLPDMSGLEAYKKHPADRRPRAGHRHHRRTARRRQRSRR